MNNLKISIINNNNTEFTSKIVNSINEIEEISDKLFLGEGTVRNYVTTLLDKLNFRDRTQLAIFYVRNS